MALHERHDVRDNRKNPCITYCIIMQAFMSDDIEYKDSGLKALIKAFSGKLPQARVGILGDHSARKAGEENNATIGLKHEFGADKMPQRSFLRIPLIDNMQKALDNSGGISEETLKKVIASSSVVPIINVIAINAENVVYAGFDTEGFGKWVAWSPGYKSATGKILQDTRQLKWSITWDVID